MSTVFLILICAKRSEVYTGCDMTRRDLLAFAPAFLFTNCGTTTSAKKAPEPPAEPVTGLTALFHCYQQARVWSQELKILQMTSIHIEQVKSEPGKAAAWQVVFLSDTTGKSRAYTYSVYDVSVTLRKGIFPERETDSARGVKPFLLAAAKADTDAVWATASKKGEAYSKKNPTVPITYTLAMNTDTNNPAWRVIWGESASSSSFSILVDASTGAYLETLH